MRNDLKAKVRGTKHDGKLLVVSLQVDRQLNKPNFQYAEYEFYVLDDLLIVDLNSSEQVLSGMVNSLDKYKLDQPQVSKLYTKVRNGEQYGFFEAILYTILEASTSAPGELNSELKGILQMSKEVLKDKLLVIIREENQQLKATYNAIAAMEV